MKKQTIIDRMIIAWIVFVFLAYHSRYLWLARTFLDVYAARYMPFLLPILSRVIP